MVEIVLKISIICNKIKTIIYYLGCSGSSWTPGFWSSILVAMDMIRPWISIKFEASFANCGWIYWILYIDIEFLSYFHTFVEVLLFLIHLSKNLNDNYKDLFRNHVFLMWRCWTQSKFSCNSRKRFLILCHLLVTMPFTSFSIYTRLA